MIILGDYTLRQLERTDLPFLASVREDPDTWKYLGTFLLGSSDSQEQFFNALLAAPDRMYPIVLFKEERIGYCRLTHIDHVHKGMAVGLDLARQFRGQGHGAKAFALIFELGFRQWSMHRLWLKVLEGNTRAQRLYTSLGFKQEGMEREAVFLDGRYQNYVLMSLLKDECAALR